MAAASRSSWRPRRANSQLTKLSILTLSLQEMDGRRILIFLETKKGCDAVTRQLRMDGWPALSIHGDKSQQERDWVLAEFKAGKHPIMIATDVAARGLGKSCTPPSAGPSLSWRQCAAALALARGSNCGWCMIPCCLLGQLCLLGSEGSGRGGAAWGLAVQGCALAAA